MRTISCILSPAASLIYEQWEGKKSTGRSKGARVSSAIVFYDAHGAQNRDGLLHQNAELIKTIEQMEKDLTKQMHRIIDLQKLVASHEEK